MKWTFDKGYQRLRSWNPIWCNYIYMDVRMRALGDDSDQWYFTDVDLMWAKISVDFDEERQYEAPTEYAEGSRVVFVSCRVLRWEKNVFEEVMLARDQNLRRMCGDAYTTLVAELDRKLRRGRVRTDEMAC